MDDSFVLDTFAWIEYFLGSKKGEKVKGFVEGNNAITPAIVIAELSAKHSSEGKAFDDKLS